MNMWLIISQIALWILVIVQIMLMISFMKMVGEFLARFRVANNKIEELTLSVGQNAPLFREKDHLNRIIRLADHPTEYTLLVFAKTSCSVCHEVLKKLSIYEHNERVRVIVNFSDKASTNNSHENTNISYVYSVDLVESYFIKKVPSIILINKDNIIEGIYNISTFDKLKVDIQNNKLKRIN